MLAKIKSNRLYGRLRILLGLEPPVTHEEPSDPWLTMGKEPEDRRATAIIGKTEDGEIVGEVEMADADRAWLDREKNA